MQGGVKLVNSPDLIAAGQYTSSIPDRPGLQTAAELGQLIAIGTRPSNKVNYKYRQDVLLMCHGLKELNFNSNLT